MKELLDMIELLSAEQQTEIIKAYIGFFSAAAVAILGFLGSVGAVMMNKYHERKVDLRKIKERQYSEFLESLAQSKMANEKERHQANNVLSARIQTIYLIGNKEVQSALDEFLQFLKGKRGVVSQDDLYGKLISTMKRDLYGRKKGIMTKISFTIFLDEEKIVKQERDIMQSTDKKEFLGGQGTVHFDHILEAEQMHGMNRVYAKVTLQKGCSVGYHVHQGDGEDYYVLKGTATIDDNHERTLKLKAGEHFFTPSGRGHSLLNLEEEELQVMALIIYDEQQKQQEQGNVR